MQESAAAMMLSRTEGGCCGFPMAAEFGVSEAVWWLTVDFPQFFQELSVFLFIFHPRPWNSTNLMMDKIYLEVPKELHFNLHAFKNKFEDNSHYRSIP